MDASPLNFHHLRYFWAVAKDGNLTRTATRLRVSQSALSAQIRQLEIGLGEALFIREGRGLKLSEAGQVALEIAEGIFNLGGELVATFKSGRSPDDTLRLGAVATLSRNFQESFIEPLLMQKTTTLVLQSGRLEQLLAALALHELDLVLSNRPPPAAPGSQWKCRRIARQRVSIVGRRRSKKFRFETDISRSPLILPGRDSQLRQEFDALCEQLGVRARVFAEVDDMAMMRLLARDTDAIALLPSVVVRDEIRNGTLREHCVVPGLFETFYAITMDRRFQHPLVDALLKRKENEILETKGIASSRALLPHAVEAEGEQKGEHRRR